MAETKESWQQVTVNVIGGRERNPRQRVKGDRPDKNVKGRRSELCVLEDDCKLPLTVNKVEKHLTTGLASLKKLLLRSKVFPLSFLCPSLRLSSLSRNPFSEPESAQQQQHLGAAHLVSSRTIQLLGHFPSFGDFGIIRLACFLISSGQVCESFDLCVEFRAAHFRVLRGCQTCS